MSNIVNNKKDYQIRFFDSLFGFIRGGRGLKIKQVFKLFF